MVIGADSEPRIGEPIAVETVPWVCPMSRFGVSFPVWETEVDAIIAIRTTAEIPPKIIPFFLISQFFSNNLKNLFQILHTSLLEFYYLALLKRPIIFPKTISSGQDSHDITEECSEECASYFSLELNILSHFSQ